jgi:hypothetical protein
MLAHWGTVYGLIQLSKVILLTNATTEMTL